MWEGAEIMQGDGKELKNALDVNGFTEEEVRDKRKDSPKSLLEKFAHWIQSCEEQTFVGQNVSFDIDMLNAAAKRENIPWSIGRRSIDLHSVMYTHYLQRGITPPTKNKKSDINLDKTLVYIGLPEEPRPHNALTGAKVEAEAFSRLLFGKNLLKSFAHYSVPDFLKK